MIGFTGKYKRQIEDLEYLLSERNIKLLENEAYHKETSARLHAEALILKSRLAELESKIRNRDITISELSIKKCELAELLDISYSNQNILKTDIATLKSELFKKKARVVAKKIASKNVPKKKSAKKDGGK
jgi:hypothetical protein